MFAPSQNDVRTFFCETHRKQRAGEPLEAIEVLAGQWISEHPEYHTELDDLEAALAAVYTVEEGRTNPFLHLSMHLSISEQVSIDQPRGIRAAIEHLAQRMNSLHEAQARGDGLSGRDDLGLAAQRPAARSARLPRRRAAARNALSAEPPIAEGAPIQRSRLRSESRTAGSSAGSAAVARANAVSAARGAPARSP